MVALSTFVIDSEEEVVRVCLGSGRVHIALRHVAGQCVKGAPVWASKGGTAFLFGGE